MSRLGLTNRTGSLELLYNPNQQAFLGALDQKTRSGAWAYKLLSLFAGRRGGKTEIGALATSRKASQNADWMIWVCAPTYRDLKDFVIPALFKYILESWVADWSESDLEMVLKNRTRIQFRSLEDPNTARGPGLNFAWLDESRKIQKLAWQTMLPALSDKAGQAIFTTTPNGYDWCYEQLWRPAELGEPGHWACKYRTADAPHFRTPQGISELDFARRTMDPLFFQQEYEADFVTFAGAIYSRVWSPDLVLDDDASIRRILPEWPRLDARRPALIGLDPGVDHPFAAVLALETPSGLVCIGEHEQRNMAISDHVASLQRLCGLDNPLEPYMPATWAIDKTQRIWAMEMAKYGLPIVPSNNDVMGGINRVMAWMRAKQLYFLKARVPRLVASLQSYQWDNEETKDGQTKPEKVRKVNDDLPDALRYMLMLYPSLPSEDVTIISPRDEQIARMTPEQQWAYRRSAYCDRQLRRNQSDDDEGLLVYGDDADLEPLGEDDAIMGHFFS